MNRRHFLRNALVLSAGVSVQVPLFSYAKSDSALPRASVVEATGSPYDLLVRKAIETAGDGSAFIKRGDFVVIKPNIGWDRKPEQAANTHPLVVKTLAELALDSGAAKVRIFDRTCNDKRRCYVNSGMKEAIKSIGDKRVRLEHMDKRKYLAVDIQGGKELTRWEVYKDVLEADCYINVPVAKHHGLSGLTLGLKNAMGVIGGNRGSLHFSLDQKLADLATLIQPNLTVIDATRMLMRNGPQGGRLKDVQQADTLIVSTDQVAADGYGSTLFGFDTDYLGSTVAAHKMGLGQMAMDKMDVTRIKV